MKYLVRKTESLDSITSDWDAMPWQGAETLAIDNFHAGSSDHRPRVQARLLHDGQSIAVIFRVEDQYVRCVGTRFQDAVCQDSCVEFFVEPVSGKGYLNFEFNCGGTLLLHHVIDPTRDENGIAEARDVAWADAEAITIVPSLSGPIDPEITDPVTWTLAARIPWTVFDPYVGAPDANPGSTMRANLYKCGDQTSKPHWGSWAPIGEALNFHVPEYFQTLVLE